MTRDEFFVCRVLSTKPERLDFIVLKTEELNQRHDVEVVSEAFATDEQASARIMALGGSIPKEPSLFLDFFEENSSTVWCWKDERTQGASQTFFSEQEALAAMRAGKLVFDILF